MPNRAPHSSAANDRIRAWRQARREAGLVKLELWVPEAARDDVKAAVRAIVTDSTRGPELAGKATNRLDLGDVGVKQLAVGYGELRDRMAGRVELRLHGG